jgi:hypothetical protein
MAILAMPEHGQDARGTKAFARGEGFIMQDSQANAAPARNEDFQKFESTREIGN